MTTQEITEVLDISKEFGVCILTEKHSKKGYLEIRYSDEHFHIHSKIGLRKAYISADRMYSFLRDC